jgi:type IX secretion system PorP/SprF family membrane protein
MKKITFFIVLLFIASSKLFAQQDPIFTEPYANPIFMNPAFAGTGNDQRIGLDFHDQLLPYGYGYTVYNAYFDRSIIDSNVGIGILANQAIMGGWPLYATNVSAMFDYQFHIESFTLSIGLQGSYINQHYQNYYFMFPGENPDEIMPENTFNKSTADFSAGLLGYGKNYFVGLALDHFNQSNGFYFNPMKFLFNGGAIIHTGLFTIFPTLLYQYQSYVHTGMLECYASRGHLTGGLGLLYQASLYNPNYAGAIFTLGFQSKYVRIGYSYNHYFSADISQTGTHEASLAVLLPYKSSRLKKTTGINIPHF